MNKHIDSIAGHGMRYDSLFYKQREAVTDEELPEYLRLHQEYENALSGTADDTFADAVQGALADNLAEEMGDPYDLPRMVSAKRELFQRAIEKERAEKARHQAIIVAAQREVRALTVSIRSLEDALDGLLVAEA